MQIVRATPADAAALTQIALAAKRHWGYPESWIQSWSDVLTIEAKFIASHETYAAPANSQITGFYALQPKGARLELLHLWVSPEAMRRGIGRALFQHAIDHARALGFHELEIESDPNAEGFYERLGARRVGTVMREVQQHQRELPIMAYKIADAPRPCERTIYRGLQSQ